MRGALAGPALVSIGILLATSGGSWDITNHLLNKPETFFAAPHAVLYSGVALAVAGAIIARFSASNRQQICRFNALMLVGVSMLVGAGPADFLWHSRFGLDGLLSPPHFVLVAGLAVSSIGSLAVLSRSSRSVLIVALASLPVWLALSGMLYMFSLPFSKTDYFDFNPNPEIAAALETIGFPFLVSSLLSVVSILTSRRFGAITIVGAGFIVVSSLTSILPNASLAPAIPFYLVNLLPIFTADIILSHVQNKYSRLAAGAVLGLMFITLYFPLITHTFNKVFTPQRAVWPSLTGIIYFDLVDRLFELTSTVAVVAGACGALAASKLFKSSRAFCLVSNS